MMDKRELLKRLWLAPVSILTMLPFSIGATLGLGAWAFDVKSGIWWFSSLALVLLSVLIYIQKLSLGWEGNKEKILREWSDKQELDRETQLNSLALRLKSDNDDRTDSLLFDLRILTRDITKEMNESSGWVKSMTLDIKGVVDQLFGACVHYLEKSLELYTTAQTVRDKAIRKINMDEREKLINEVHKSLSQLGDILSNVRAINLKRVTNSTGSNTESDGLEQLRKELAVKLQSAKEIEQAVTSGIPFPGVDVRKYIEKAREAGEEGGRNNGTAK